MIRHCQACVAKLLAHNTGQQQVSSLILGSVNFFLRIGDSHCDRIDSSFTAYYCFHAGY